MEEICSLHAVYQHNTRLEYARYSHLQLHLPGRHEWGTPTTHQSLQASQSPFSESQRLQGESGGTSMQTGRALLQHRLGNARLTQRRYFLLQSHRPYTSWNAQIHSLESAVTRRSDPQQWTPECTESVKAKHRVWKQLRTLNNSNSSHARYTRSCTTAKNCQLQAKSSYRFRLRGCLTSENLQSNQWWSTVKLAAGDKKGSDIPTLRNSCCWW